MFITFNGDYFQLKALENGCYNMCNKLIFVKNKNDMFPANFLNFLSTLSSTIENRIYVKYTCSMETVQQNSRFTLFSSSLWL